MRTASSLSVRTFEHVGASITPDFRDRDKCPSNPHKYWKKSVPPPLGQLLGQTLLTTPLTNKKEAGEYSITTKSNHHTAPDYLTIATL